MYIILDCVQVRSIGQEQVRNNGPLPPGTVVDNDPVILWWERLLYTKHVITVATELSSLLMYNYNINKSILLMCLYILIYSHKFNCNNCTRWTNCSKHILT